MFRTTVSTKHDGITRTDELKEENELEENDLNSQLRRASTFKHSGEMKMTDFNRKNREEGYEIFLLSCRLASTSEHNFKQCSSSIPSREIQKN